MAKPIQAFVATGTIPPSPPPGTEIGAIRWVRENLFSSITNSILTILSLALIAWLLTGLLPWFFGSVWEAASLQDCRSKGTGACFAVINERFNQFLYGFYPADQYWRPSLTFVLLFLAMAPVLFTGLPRGMLRFAAIFPAIAYFLVFGGSLWGPVMVLAAFAAGYFV
ncbi:MAG TPA: amino acid ABC transporter permease, partial [Paracoccaceae bacterium]|nr:amino acid ABC transporter permease [Paracoccaceae bacterium]